MAKWSTEYINDLPDSAFLFIEKGGEKDKEGKTTPRGLRHLPYKNHKGNIDLPHVRNALARLNQVETKDGKKLSQEKQDKLEALLENILEKGKKRSEMSKEEVKEDKKEADVDFEDDNEIEDEKIISDTDIKKQQKPKEDKPVEPKENKSDKPKDKPKEDKTNNKPNEKTKSTSKKSNGDDDLKIKLDSTQNALKEALQLNDEMISTLNESKGEIESLKSLNGDLMNKISKKESELSQFQQLVNEYENEKKEAKVNAVFNQYCDFFEIPNEKKTDVRKMMFNMSEDMLEQTQMLFSHKKKTTPSVVPLTKPSASLSQFSETKQKEPDVSKMTPKERVDYMFNKIVKNK